MVSTISYRHQIGSYQFNISYGKHVGFKHLGETVSQQDDVIVVAGDTWLLSVIADGVGHYKQSEKASAYVTALARDFPRIISQAGGNAFKNTVVEKALFNEARATVGNNGWGDCTLTTLLFFLHEGVLYRRIVHTGNTRVYERKGEWTTQLTDDESFLGYLGKQIESNPEKEPTVLVDGDFKTIGPSSEKISWMFKRARRTIGIKDPRTEGVWDWSAHIDPLSALGRSLLYNWNENPLQCDAEVYDSVPSSSDLYLGTTDGIHDILDRINYHKVDGKWKKRESRMGETLDKLSKKRFSISRKIGGDTLCDRLIALSLEEQRRKNLGDNIAAFVVEVCSH